jgi:predicted ATPase
LLAAVQGLLAGTAGNEPHLVTLTGIGGGGKTRVALEVAARLCDPALFPDGVYFVGLAPVTNPELVVPTIAHTVGVPDLARSSPLVRLQEALRQSRMLLVLDNIEHLLTAAPDVTKLLMACPGVRILATGRAPLHLCGERQIVVPPLALPDPRIRLCAEQVAVYDAVRLFVARAQDVAAGFALTAETAPAIVAVCHRLDGLPLALELAATRCKVLPPAALLARLERRLPLLTGGARDLPARQQSLRDALAWSYELLTPAAQALFRRLAIFSGGCTLEAAAAVSFDGGPREDALLDVLESVTQLVDKSLVHQTALARCPHALEEPRYMMLETVREYASEQLVASGEAEVIARRHAAYHHAQAEEAASALKGRGGKTVLQFAVASRQVHDTARGATSAARSCRASQSKPERARCCDGSAGS